MSKRITKIICASVAVIAAFGIAASVGCGNYGGTPLGTDKGEIFTEDNAQSNGGFAVKKGNYVYFINGAEANTADNSYGTPVKGAIYRIAASDLAARNYNEVQPVVKHIAYAADHNSGIFIYGDRIYYSTPSTAKNSDGSVLSSYLELKSTKLDGTDTLSTAYVQFPSNAYEFRYVEEGGTVYLMYVATSEKLYEEETGVTNLHSYNTATGTDTLLAYNVSSVAFDGADKTNPRVYYTMNVRNYVTDSNYGYNQIYTVTASATEDKFADKVGADKMDGWNDDEEEGTVDRYVNCGDLVLDGIGEADRLANDDYSATVFNYDPTGATHNGANRYTYTLSAYQGGMLFYTRDNDGDGSKNLFNLKDGALASWNTETNNPVKGNPEQSERLLKDGSSASGYKFTFDDNGDLTGAVIAESSGGITVNKFTSGKFSEDLGTDNYYYVLSEGTATLLFTDGDFVYYSVSGRASNGYSINRLKYTGGRLDYGKLPTSGDADDYTDTQILNLDASSDWFVPELIDGQLLFASETDNTVLDANYIMACDLRGTDGKVLGNKEIEELNRQFKGIDTVINGYEDTEKYPTKTYANVKNAVRYAYYTGDSEYIKELAAAVNAELEEDADRIYSDETLAEYNKFLTPSTEGNLWKTGDYDYSVTRPLNGGEINANRRDYYYSVLGEMNEEDKEAYADGLKSTYLQSMPEKLSWWDSLSTVARVFFIIGMCVLGLIVLAGIAALILVLCGKKQVLLKIFRRNKDTEDKPRRRRIKVDTTDDKDIDVYAGDENAETEEGSDEGSQE